MNKPGATELMVRLVHSHLLEHAHIFQHEPRTISSLAVLIMQFH